MIDPASLGLFFLLVFGIVLLPGLDMACVLASALAGGRRSGFAATAGIVAGGVCHVALGALGLVAVLQLVPEAFNAMLLAGAAYIAWIGYGLLRSEVALGPVSPAAARSSTGTFARGLVTSLLNPKAYLFMLAIFPQFLRPERGDVATQAVMLWIVIAATQLGVYGSVAWAGDGLRRWLGTRPAANRALARGVGLLLLATAAYTAAEGWRGV